MTIGEKIRTKRQEKGLTQDELAYKCNVSRQTIYKWENDIALPETNNLPSLVSLLDLTYEELLGKPDDVSCVPSYSSQGSIASNVETFIKKHWQKISYALTIGGLGFILLGAVSMMIIKMMFGSTSNSGFETTGGFGDSLVEDGLAQMEALESSGLNAMNTISIVVISLGVVSLIVGIIGIIYDRQKMKKYNSR